MKEQVNGFERILEYEPAFDRRDPDPAKNYGIHGVTMRWVLRGELGAIQFLLYTNWQLAHVREEHTDSLVNRVLLEPMPADLGYHSPKPMYDDQALIEESCEWLDGKPCYYDGSSLNAGPVFDLLVSEGEEALWDRLEAEYRNRFGGEAVT